MLILYIFMLLLGAALTVCYRLIKAKKVVLFVFLGVAAITMILGMVFGYLYGKKLFEHDDPKLGGAIFLIFALAYAHVLLFVITYKSSVLVSRIALGVAFLLSIAFIIMSIYEAKVSFGNGIGSNSPLVTSGTLSLLFSYNSYIV